MTHQLKVWPEQFEALRSKLKRFEIRKNDRDFKVGDTLVLREFDPQRGYTGEQTLRDVDYIMTARPEWGLAKDHVIMSLSHMGEKQRKA